MTPEILTTRQVAELLQVTVETVRDWTRAGIIPAIEIRGPVRRYCRRDVLDALRERQWTGSNAGEVRREA